LACIARCFLEKKNEAIFHLVETCSALRFNRLRDVKLKILVGTKGILAENAGKMIAIGLREFAGKLAFTGPGYHSQCEIILKKAEGSDQLALDDSVLSLPDSDNIAVTRYSERDSELRRRLARAIRAGIVSAGRQMMACTSAQTKSEKQNEARPLAKRTHSVLR
jgi:hypothetical protein